MGRNRRRSPDPTRIWYQVEGLVLLAIVVGVGVSLIAPTPLVGFGAAVLTGLVALAFHQRHNPMASAVAGAAQADALLGLAHTQPFFCKSATMSCGVVKRLCQATLGINTICYNKSE